MTTPESKRLIIDAHTHLFPDEVIRHRDRFREMDPWFSELFENPLGGMATGEELLASMDDAGIDQSIVCGWPWRDQGICRMHNDFLADVASQHPGRIAWLAIVNPSDREAAAEIQRSASKGAVGIGEINADAQEFDLGQPAHLSTFAEACTSLALPVLLHCTEPVGHHYYGKGSAYPERVIDFVAKYPALKVVAAHWGGGLPFYELMPEIAERLTNVVYDTAASTYLYRHSIFDVVFRLVGGQRILFGSDFPVLRQATFARAAQRALGSDADLDALMAGNARRVYRMDGAP